MSIAMGASAAKGKGSSKAESTESRKEGRFPHPTESSSQKIVCIIVSRLQHYWKDWVSSLNHGTNGFHCNHTEADAKTGREGDWTLFSPA